MMKKEYHDHPFRHFAAALGTASTMRLNWHPMIRLVNVKLKLTLFLWFDV